MRVVSEPPSRRRERSFTQPLENLTAGLLTLVVALISLAAVGSIWNHSMELWGFGHAMVCVDHVPLNGLATDGGGALAHLRAGATSGSSGVSVCQQAPTLYERFLVTLTQAPGNLLFVSILALVLRLLAVASRIGPFDRRIVARLRLLAWFVLAGSVTASVVQGLATNYFLGTAVTDSVPTSADVVNDVLNTVWTPLLIACGLLTIARIVAMGARMNDDLAGTV